MILYYIIFYDFILHHIVLDTCYDTRVPRSSPGYPCWRSWRARTGPRRPAGPRTRTRRPPWPPSHVVESGGKGDDFIVISLNIIFIDFLMIYYYYVIIILHICLLYIILILVFFLLYVAQVQPLLAIRLGHQRVDLRARGAVPAAAAPCRIFRLFHGFRWVLFLGRLRLLVILVLLYMVITCSMYI